MTQLTRADQSGYIRLETRARELTWVATSKYLTVRTLSESKWRADPETPPL